MEQISFTHVPDRELLETTVRVAADERRVTAELLALLGELDARGLYLGEGCSSLFTYCTQRLRLSEHAAYHRIEAARAARQFPIILSLVAGGALTLTTVALLRPHLTTANYEALLTQARHKSKRDVELQVAAIAPRPDMRPLIRRATDSSPAKTLAAEVATPAAAPPVAPTPVGIATASRPVVAPLAPDRYLLKVTVPGETHAKLRRAQDLMRHTIPSGDPAAILDKALTLLIEQLERTKIAKASRPRPSPAPIAPRRHTRHIPASVRRAVWARDEGRCAFIGPHGRCEETGCLEFHHLVPFADGGPTEEANLALRCRAHNRFESERWSGVWPGEEAAARDEGATGA